MFKTVYLNNVYHDKFVINVIIKPNAQISELISTYIKESDLHDKNWRIRKVTTKQERDAPRNDVFCQVSIQL